MVFTIIIEMLASMILLTFSFLQKIKGELNERKSYICYMGEMNEIIL